MNKKLKISYIINIILLFITIGISTYAYNLYNQNIKLKNNATKVVIKKKVYPKRITKNVPKIASNKVNKQQTTKQLSIENASDAETALAIIYYAQKLDRQDWHSLIEAMNHNSELVITLVNAPKDIKYKGQGVAYYLNTNTRSQGSSFYTLDKDNTIHFYSGLNKEYIGSATKEQVFDYINSKGLVNKVDSITPFTHFYDFRNQDY